jgi:hypothetical protein
MGILEGMVWLFVMGHLQTRENTSKQGGDTSKQGKTLPNKGGTLPNKGKHPQTRGGDTSKQVGNTTKQEKKYLLNKKNPSKQENAFQARGIFQSNVVYKW